MRGAHILIADIHQRRAALRKRNVRRRGRPHIGEINVVQRGARNVGRRPKGHGREARGRRVGERGPELIVPHLAALVMHLVKMDRKRGRRIGNSRKKTVA